MKTYFIRYTVTKWLTSKMSSSGEGRYLLLATDNAYDALSSLADSIISSDKLSDLDILSMNEV